MSVSELAAHYQRLLPGNGKLAPNAAPEQYQYDAQWNCWCYLRRDEPFPGTAPTTRRTKADVTKKFSMSLFLGKIKQLEDRVAEIDEERKAQGIEIHDFMNRCDVLEAGQIKLQKAVESRDKKVDYLKSELAKLQGN
ncbi:hypothetical protein IFR05_011632 [Cadophora sp. M221]|nr:hypothetical protein IFR05_011632 [Cadophora sp. M221]